jgi:hypothetical protein
MRATTFAIAATALVAGCTVSNKCKNGTVLVTATFDASASSADELDVVVQLDQAAMMTATLPGPAGKSSGTLEVQFPHGYHAGSTLQVTITATSGGQTVASGSASATLSSGCSTLNVAVTASGGGNNDLSMSDMLMLPVPAVTAKPDYVGFTTSLDGSGTTDPLGASLTFAWEVKQVPAGSAIKTTSLTSTSAAKTAFDPDRGGLYKIALTATAMDGRSATLVTDVSVPTVPLLYVRASQTTTTAALGPHVVSSDGTNDHSIGCDLTFDGGVDTNTLQQSPFLGHVWEPPATSTSQALFVFLGNFDLTGATAPHLLVGSPSTNCTTNPPTRVDNNVFNDHFAVTARFSPDGTRIVYVDAPQNSNQGSYRLVTVSVDGTGPKRVVRSDGFFGFTPAIWLDNSTVAWLERDGNAFNPFTIFKAPDENAAGDPGANTKRTQLLRCDPSTTSTHLGEINQFEVSAFGMIVAGSTSARAALNPPPLPGVSLYKLANGDCSTTTAKVLAAEPVGGLSWDFSISPDGLNILFSSTGSQDIPDGGLPEPQTDIFLVPADGSASAQKFVGDPLYDDINPRFVAGGRQFIWSQTPRRLDMGADTPALMIANADGTHIRSFTPTGAAGETIVGTAAGANRGYDCSWIPGAVSASAGMAFAGAALLLLLAFRPRRRD